MIKQLQHRFIRIAVLALTLAMVLAVAAVNMANWIAVRQELKNTVALIAETDWIEGENGMLSPGSLPGEDAGQPRNVPGETPPPKPEERGSMHPPEGSGETPPPLPEQTGDRTPPEPAGSPGRGPGDPHSRNLMNESSWFSLLAGSDGSMEVLDRRLVTETDEAVFLNLGRQAADSGGSSGFIGDYVWTAREEPNGTKRLVFLNCETRMTAVRNLAMISGIACLAGILLALALTALASRRAVQPTLRNMEQQKQFITNASHELKTPITVISTNMSLLQMELPDNQWVRSTQKQTGILRKLVDELVYLSRMEEENPPLTMETLHLAPLLEEGAEPFAAMAEYSGREMKVEAEPDLRIRGDRSSIQRLISILCDNAVKYAGGEGDILLRAKAEGRNAVLSVSNPVAEPLSREQCERLFARFYRTDESRNKEKKSGFGIGLAIAAAIAGNHGGSIRAAMEGEGRLAITCTLPRESGPEPGEERHG